MTDEELEATLNDVAFTHHPSLTVRVGYDPIATDYRKGQGFYFQPWLQLVDTNLPVEFRSGRKWRLTQHMTPSEVVGTAFAAYKAWLEHEMMESFTYKGVQVFSPHLDIEARVRLASDRDNYEYRS